MKVVNWNSDIILSVRVMVDIVFGEHRNIMMETIHYCHHVFVLCFTFEHHTKWNLNVIHGHVKQSTQR